MVIQRPYIHVGSQRRGKSLALPFVGGNSLAFPFGLSVLLASAHRLLPHTTMMGMKYAVTNSRVPLAVSPASSLTPALIRTYPHPQHTHWPRTDSSHLDPRQLPGRIMAGATPGNKEKMWRHGGYQDQVVSSEFVLTHFQGQLAALKKHHPRAKMTATRKVRRLARPTRLRLRRRRWRCSLAGPRWRRRSGGPLPRRRLSRRSPLRRRRPSARGCARIRRPS